MSNFNPDQAEKNFRARIVRERADKQFTEKWLAETLKAEKENVQHSAPGRERDHRMEDHRRAAATFSDVEIAAITSPR
jgi:hypothetical protein